MNSNDQLSKAAAVFCDVMEHMAFIFGEITNADELPSVSGADILRASMTFKGPISGKIEIWVTDEICPLIAENMLGVDADDPRVLLKAHDALKELLNVTCGNIMTALAGDDPVFDLSIPEVMTATSDEWNAAMRSAHACPLLVDDYPMLLLLTMQL